MRVTSKAISKAIKEATGIDHVGVWRGEGYQYFYSDDEVIGELIAHESSSVYVFRMSDLTIEQWVKEFQHIYAEIITGWILNIFHPHEFRRFGLL